MYTLHSVHTPTRTVESVESYETIDSLITDTLNYIWEDDNAFYFITKESDNKDDIHLHHLIFDNRSQCNRSQCNRS